MSNSQELATVREKLDAMADVLAGQLPPHIPVARFIGTVMTAVQKNPALLTGCDRASLFLACKEAAEDGLLPDGRESAIVPHKGRATHMPMVAGLVKLAWQCGGLAALHADVAYEGEVFAVHGGTAPRIVHEYDLDRRGNGGSLDGVRAVYAVAKLTTGETMQAVLTLSEVAKVRSISRSTNGPWATWPVAMATVRAVRRLTKLLPLSSDRDADDRMRRAAERGDVIDGVAEDTTGQPAISVPEGGKLAALEHALDTGALPDLAPEREPEPSTLPTASAALHGLRTGQPVQHDERDPNWMDAPPRTPTGKPEGDDKPAQAARRWVRLVEGCATEDKLDALLSAGDLRRDQAWYRDNGRPELAKLVGDALTRQFDKVGNFPGDRP